PAANRCVGLSLHRRHADGRRARAAAARKAPAARDGAGDRPAVRLQARRSRSPARVSALLPAIIGVAGAFVVAALIAWMVSRRRSDPSARRLSERARELEARLGQMTTEREHFDAVLGAMAEGVLLLNHAGQLLLANPAAREMLALDA